MNISDEKNLSKETANRLFGYESGNIYRKDNFKNIPIRATKTSHGKKYRVAALSIDGKKRMILAHRIIWNIHYGKIPDGMIIDHINNDSLDNRIENLQCITQSENIKRIPTETRAKPRKPIQRHFKSGIVGLYTDGQRHYIRLNNGRKKYLS